VPELTAEITEVRARDDGYTAVIAVNDEVDGGMAVDLAALDLDTYRRNPVVLWNHEREEPPIGRATELRQDEAGRIEADFEFAPDDQRASSLRNLWDRGFLRGASIGWRRRSDGQNELVEWSLVSVPADRDAVRAATEIIGGEESMTDEEIRELVEQALSAQAEQFASQIAELRESGETQMAAAERAELLVATRSLIADDVDTTAMTDREILTLAIGDELPDAEQRSTGYLRATLDGIVERRAAAERPSAPPTSYGGSYSSGAAIRAMQRAEVS